MESEIDLPVFMGVCESALVRGDGVLQDFYGVGDLVLLPFFPQNLSGIFLLIGITKKLIDEEQSVSFIIRDKKKLKSKAWIDLKRAVIEPAVGKADIFGYSKPYQKIKIKDRNKISEGQSARLLIPQNLVYKLLAFPCPPLFVTEPTEVDVIVKIGEQESVIGSFECRFVPTQPISEQERTAIMSRPGAIKGIVYGISCKKCFDEMWFHLSIDESEEAPTQFKNSILLTTAPNEWNCKCEETKIDLTYLKKGFHNFFRMAGVIRDEKEVKFFPLYQTGAIAAIISEYQKIIVDHADDEEMLSTFIEETPILWNFLAPIKVWKKPAVLTKYKADFAILNRSSILYLVEIEKPITKLIKKGGGLSSELQKGLDQIRDWRTELEKRREAVLDGLGLSQKDVHDIRYILIAGMASKTPAKGLEKIRRMKTDADFIFCFDEIASFLHSTETAILNI